MAKSRDAFRTISEVAEWLDTPAHVLRFWESKFTQVKPVKRAGGRRYYRPDDMMLLSGIKVLLHEQGLTIKGAQKLLREQGVKHVSALGEDPDGLRDTLDVIEGTASEVDRVDKAPETKSTAPQTAAPQNIAPQNTGQPNSAPKITINFGASRPAPPPQTDPSANAPDTGAPPAGPVRASVSPDTGAVPEAPPPEGPPLPMSDNVARPTTVALDSTRRAGRIPALPMNPGAFARPGVLTALLKSRRSALLDRSAALAPLAARLRARADAMKDAAR